MLRNLVSQTLQSLVKSIWGQHVLCHKIVMNIVTRVHFAEITFAQLDQKMQNCQLLSFWSNVAHVYSGCDRFKLSHIALVIKTRVPFNIDLYNYMPSDEQIAANS